MKKSVEKHIVTDGELRFLLKIEYFQNMGADMSSHKKLAYLLNFSTQSTMKYTASLIKKGFLSIESRSGKNGFINLILLADPISLLFT